jgi:MerR family mercuric resistance operon transcriptional regulator
VRPLRIGKLARVANVNVQTLRFYEREGLLFKPHRRLSGYREYPPEAIGLVRLVKRIQALGFSLKEIKAVLALGRGLSATIGDPASLIQSKVEEIDAKIAELRELRQALVTMVTSDRKAPAAPFAPVFQDYVRQLSEEALAGDHARAGDRKRDQPKKISRDA